MADDTAAFLDTLGIGRAHLVGHSDGANVALLVAMARPDLVAKMVLISGNFHHDGLITGLDLSELAASSSRSPACATRSSSTSSPANRFPPTCPSGACHPGHLRDEPQRRDHPLRAMTAQDGPCLSSL